MLTFNVELVEKLETKTQDDLKMSTNVKDCIRQHAIKDIINTLTGCVLEHYQSYKADDVRDTLFVLAQLIDWNDLADFEPLVVPCMSLLQDGQQPQSIRNGAFNCI